MTFPLLDPRRPHSVDVLTNLGEFAFRLLPNAARYRVTAKFGSLAPAVKEIDIEGPSVYRMGLSLGPPAP